MARLTYRDTELNRCDDRTIILDIVEGFDDEPETRGKDVVIPGRPGMYPANRIKHRRVVRLRGVVKGVGATPEDREESYRDLVDELHAIFDPTLDPAALTVTAPYLTVSGSRTLEDVRYVNAVWGPFLSRHARTVDIEMESIANPPDWTDDGS
jgi:hypothetical protein